jgi:glucose-6-phosphate dehydrogenase assembly protein OpcA
MPRSMAKTLTQAVSSKPLVVAARPDPVNTRRAPRFLVRDPLDVSVESGVATLVDISVLGAQLVSVPVLRPGQKINVGLPDTGETLNVVAQVAWSTYEKVRTEQEPHYRVGLEFTDAGQHALEDYRQRHGADQIVPFRAR